MFNAALVFIIIVLYFAIYSNKRINEETRKKLFLVICFFLFFILVGFRSFETGSDTPTYLKSFRDAVTLRWGHISKTRFEVGYGTFEVLMGYVTTSGRIFLLVLSAIFNYGVYRFIKKYSDNYLLSVIMYVCLLFFYFSMTGLRQFFAIILILYSFRYVKTKKIIPFILSIVLASSFHVTSMICLLLYPMYHMSFTRLKSFMLICVAILMMLIISSASESIFAAIGWDYSYGIRENDYSLANLLYFLMYGLMFVLSLSLRGRCNSSQQKKSIDFYIYVFLISALINLIAIRMNVLARLAEYFTIFSIVALPNIIHNTCNQRKELDYNLIIIAFLLMYSTTIIVNRPEWNTAYNYKTCLMPDNGYICE